MSVTYALSFDQILTQKSIGVSDRSTQEPQGYISDRPENFHRDLILRPQRGLYSALLGTDRVHHQERDQYSLVTRKPKTTMLSRPTKTFEETEVPGLVSILGGGSLSGRTRQGRQTESTNTGRRNGPQTGSKKTRNVTQKAFVRSKRNGDSIRSTRDGHSRHFRVVSRQDNTNRDTCRRSDHPIEYSVSESESDYTRS